MSAEKTKKRNRRRLDPEAKKLFDEIRAAVLDFYYKTPPGMAGAEGRPPKEQKIQERKVKCLERFTNAYVSLRQYILEHAQPQTKDNPPVPDTFRTERDRLIAKIKALKLALCRYSLDQDRTLRLADVIQTEADRIFKDIYHEKSR